jgi:hypothetical protein
MNLENSHELLVSGTDFDTCREKALLFFSKNLLVRYDTVSILEEESVTAEDSSFWERISQGEAANRQAIKSLFEELKGEGYEGVNDFLVMEQGFQSKLFHTIAHLLDGFFGIDSTLYNLEDDSHWVSRTLRNRIQTAPGKYRLLKINAESKGSTADRLHLLRSITKEKE